MKLHPTDIESAASAWIARRDIGLSPDEKAEFERWAEVPLHAAALSRHEKAWRIYDRPFRAGQGKSVAGQLRAKLAARRRRVGITAAAFICALSVGLYWRVHPTKSDTASQANAVVILPEQRALPDGSRVELKPGADIAIAYSDEVRRVFLREGQVHFQVVTNPSRPFIVSVGVVNLRAVGTAFAVDLDAKSVAVIVTEGVVAVEASTFAGEGRGPESRPLALVDAGKQVTIELLAASAAPVSPVLISSPEMAEKLAWRSPQLEFSGVPLSEAVALMNRHGGSQLVVEDARIADIEVTGVFRADNTATFLHLLEKGVGVHSQRRGAQIILRKGP